MDLLNTLWMHRKPSVSHLSLPGCLEASGQSKSSSLLCLFLGLTLAESMGKYITADICSSNNNGKKKKTKTTIDHFRELSRLKLTRWSQSLILFCGTQRRHSILRIFPSPQEGTRGEEWAYLPQKPKRALECLVGLWGRGVFS